MVNIIFLGNALDYRPVYTERNQIYSMPFSYSINTVNIKYVRKDLKGLRYKGITSATFIYSLQTYYVYFFV